MVAVSALIVSAQQGQQLPRIIDNCLNRLEDSLLEVESLRYSIESRGKTKICGREEFAG
jgi:hypothetical protein